MDGAPARGGEPKPCRGSRAFERHFTSPSDVKRWASYLLLRPIVIAENALSAKNNCSKVADQSHLRHSASNEGVSASLRSRGIGAQVFIEQLLIEETDADSCGGGGWNRRLLRRPNAAVGAGFTYLVRERRAQQLAERGLVIRSQFGDATVPNPPTTLAEDLRNPYDLVLLSCKAYDLENAIESFTSAVGERTLILPLLNGMRHLDVLDQRFGNDRVLEGSA